MGIIIKLIQNILYVTNDSNDKARSDKQTLTHTLIMFSAFVSTLVLMLLLGKILWNDYLTELVPGIKKVDSVFQLAAIFLLIQLMF